MEGRRNSQWGPNLTRPSINHAGNVKMETIPQKPANVMVTLFQLKLRTYRGADPECGRTCPKLIMNKKLRRNKGVGKLGESHKLKATNKEEDGTNWKDTAIQ